MPFHVVPIKLPRHASRIDAGHVAQQQLSGRSGFNRNGSQIVHRVRNRLRHFDLQLIANAGFRVGPIIRHHKPRRAGGGHQRLRHLLRRHPAQAGKLAVDFHFDRGILQRLRELQIAQRRNFGEFLPQLFGKYDVVGEIRAADRHINRRGGAEAHYFIHNIGRLE